MTKPVGCRFAQLLSELYLDSSLDLTPALESLLLTQSHVVLRFEKYLHYPTKLWMLCERYNSTGYIAQCETFLEEEEALLDVGYSLKLRNEAQQKDNYAQQLAFLVSPQIQAELCGIVEHASTSSMPVERKHAMDKRNEKIKVVGIARASRNSILQRYRVKRFQFIKRKLDTVKKWRGQRFVNARSIAIRRNPDLFSRARGQLKSQPALPAEKRAEIIHAGDQDALQEYIDRNKDTLEQEAAETRKAAKDNLQQLRAATLPYSNQEWLTWLDDNDSKLRQHLREATAKRRHISIRIQQTEPLPRAPRLQAEISDPVHGDWGRILKQQKSGWACLSHEGRPAMVFWFCSVATLLRGIRCVKLQGSNFCIDSGEDVWERFLPMERLLLDSGLRLDTPWQVDGLQVSLVFS